MKILVINGPNLNMLGLRDKGHYGSFTLNELNEMIINKYPKINFDFYQSNYEGDIVSKLNKGFNYDAILINAAAYTHTSVAIRDALEILTIPKASVHLSNYLNREEFRKVDYIKDVVLKVFYGKKDKSYFEAIDFLIAKVTNN